MSRTVAADVSLNNHTVSVHIDPVEFLNLVPLFLLKAEVKRRSELPEGTTQPATATMASKDFLKGQTIEIETEVDINTTTDVEVEEDEEDGKAEADATSDDIDDIVEAFLDRDASLFELRLSRIIPNSLTDRLSMRIRR